MIQPRLLFLILVLFSIMAGSFLVAQPIDNRFKPIPGVERYDGPLRVLGLEDNQTLKRTIADLAFESRQTIRQQTDLDWKDTAYILWTSEQDFQRLTNFDSEFTIAAANASKMTIWINENAWKAASPSDRQKTMTHEMGHLFVGQLSPNKRLPLWVEEGIVQHLAGEWSWARGQEFNLGLTTDRLPTLSELEYAFPKDQKLRQLAYLVSYQAVTRLIEEYAGTKNEQKKATIGGLLYHISNATARESFLADVWDPEKRDAWNSTMHQSGSKQLASFLATVLSDGTFWFIAILLVIVAWIKQRIQRARRNRVEVEESWRESLTQDDIVDIYGPQEGTGIPEELTPWDKHKLEQEEEENRREDHHRQC